MRQLIGKGSLDRIDPMMLKARVQLLVAATALKLGSEDPEWELTPIWLTSWLARCG